MFDKKTVISERFKSVFLVSMLAMVGSYIIFLVDNIVAGQILGDDAVAAMTLIFPIFSLILFVGYMISDGLAMMASYANGQQNRAEVDRLFSLGSILTLIFSVIFLMLFIFLREEILSFWEISPELKFFAEEYYDGLIFLSFTLLAETFLYTFFIAEGLERICLIAANVQLGSNIILDIVLCEFFGVKGIGIATSLGTFASVVILMYYLISGKTQLHFKWYWNLKKTWQGIFYSFYHSVDTLCLSILPVLISMEVIKYFGEEKIIIVTVAINLLTLLIEIYTGLVDCLQPMICQYHAENNLHSVIKTMKIGMAATVAISLIMTFAGMIFADFLPAMFGVTDEKLVNEAAVAMRYFLPFTVFLGCALMLGNYYIYIEKLNYGALIKILLLLVLPVAAMFFCGNFALTIFGRFTMNVFWLSIGSSFLAAYLINYFYLKPRAGLLMIDGKNLNRQLSYDINATFEEVMALTKKIDEDLTLRGVDNKIKNKVVLCVEEFGLNTVERVKENIFQMEIAILFDDKITLIIRDNGAPYDIIKTAQEQDFNFREFFIESVTAQFFKRNYISTGDENRVTLQF